MESKSSNTSESSSGQLEEERAEDLIALSALQHYIYCPRQCALIHVEGQWSENRYTAEGQILHRRADSAEAETRHDVRVVRSMPIRSDSLGVTGRADIVEFHETSDGEEVVPVEYKRGRPKSHRADEVQLCAQAIALEEMLVAEISEGALFYGKRRRREVVLFDDRLRAYTREIAQKTRDLISRGRTPRPHYSRKLCDRCSLLDVCQPRALTKSASVRKWLLHELED